MDDRDPFEGTAGEPDHEASGLSQRLLGAWRLLRAEDGAELARDARLDFAEEGMLRYSFSVSGQSFAMELRWRVDRGMLHTSVPESGFTRDSRVMLGEGGVLILDFGGARAYFVRER